MSEIVVAIIENNNKILLVRRKYNEEGMLHWQFPGGSIEEGETENQAIEIEVFEETNINCKAVRKIGERIHPNTGRTISYWFCSYISGDAYVKDSKELDAVRWMFPLDVFKYVTSDIFKPVKEYLLNKIEEMNLILKNKKSESIKRLQSLRNIGPVTAERLYSIGIKTPEQMKNSDPEMLYEKLKRESGGALDKCVLYQLQGAVLDVPWPKCKDLTKGKHKN